MLDPVLGKLQFDVLGDRLVLRGLEAQRHQSVFGRIEGDADDFHLAGRRAVHLAD
ncbi:hypothetical protein D3C87_1942840 [compost metagenome]